MSDELTEADRALLTSHAARALRAQLASLLTLYRPHVDRLDHVAPSYVRASMMNLLASFDRWTVDETTASLIANART